MFDTIKTGLRMWKLWKQAKPAFDAGIKKGANVPTSKTKILAALGAIGGILIWVSQFFTGNVDLSNLPELAKLAGELLAIIGIPGAIWRARTATQRIEKAVNGE